MNAFTKIIMLLSVLVLLIGGGFSFYFTYQSGQPVRPVSAGADGIAIEGFDAVAYHKTGAAQKGQYNFQVTWNGGLWHFTSLENRQNFSENPEKYAPQYGGYDPLGMAMNGSTEPGTPELWTVVDGKLYLFYSGKTRKIWQENAPENRKKADHQWYKLKQQRHYKTEMK